MEILSIHTLKALFDFIEIKPTTVLWVRSPDYQRQLYVSPAYENVWGQKTELLYEHPESWNDFLYKQDAPQMEDHIEGRVNNPVTLSSNVLFRIITPQQQIKYIKDCPLILTNENGTQVGFAGISEVLSEQQWQDEWKAKNALLNHSPQEQMKKYLFNILKNELHIQATEKLHSQAKNIMPAYQAKCILKQTNEPVLLTNREMECLKHLLDGKSAKQSAAMMNISTRTVEFHLNNIKMKTASNSKLEILSKIIIT